jgi:myo-inositol-1(or 4)-monophosphatase
MKLAGRGACSMTDHDVAIAVAQTGALVVRRCFGNELERKDKGAGDFATQADIEAETAMLAILRRERPDDAILGEESGEGGARHASRRWLLDPLCGTLNYAAGMRVVAVNVALTTAAGFVAAAVADPFNDEVYWTDMKSAFMRSAGGDTRLQPSARSRLVDLNFDPPFPNAAAFRATTLSADPEFVAAFKPRVVSSTIAVAWVATGQRAAYVTDGNLRDSVHFSAGLAVCEAAGCIVTDLWGNPWGAGPTGVLVAADRETHVTLLQLVAKQLT